MAVCQNLVPLVNIKIAGKWMFIPLKMVLIGIDPYPHHFQVFSDTQIMSPIRLASRLPCSFAVAIRDGPGVACLALLPAMSLSDSSNHSSK